MVFTKRRGVHLKVWLPVKELFLLKGMIFTKRNGFLKNSWLPLFFSLQFVFIANKVSFGIENYELFFSFTRIFIKDKSISFSPESILMFKNFSLIFCLALITSKQPLLRIKTNLSDKQQNMLKVCQNLRIFLIGNFTATFKINP